MPFDRLLILDTETTGLDPATGVCIEVACTLYDVEHAMPLASYASLIRAESNAAFAVNGIPEDVIREETFPNEVWPRVLALAQYADAIVAHRAEFDRQFVNEFLLDYKWLCSKFDIEWPKGKPGDHLVHLALAHGVPVFSAHRAMADVDTLVRTFQAAHALIGVDGVRAMLDRAARPKRRYVAKVSYDDREKAKAAGFAWDGSKREWSRNMAAEDVAALTFPVVEA